MKKIGYSIVGAIFFGGLCIGITWLLGALFGPLYHGEEESSRNFGIFLYSLFAFVIGGAMVDYVANYYFVTITQHTINHAEELESRML
ncbi:MAG: hypothetical protein V4660_10120 [Pseudomonadota bacterium]